MLDLWWKSGSTTGGAARSAPPTVARRSASAPWAGRLLAVEHPGGRAARTVGVPGDERDIHVVLPGHQAGPARADATARAGRAADSAPVGGVQDRGERARGEPVRDDPAAAPAAAMRALALSGESTPSTLTAAASCCGRCGVASSSVSPGSTTSGTAFTAVATTGSPAIMASATAHGSPSYLLARMSTSSPGSSCGTSSRCPTLMKRPCRPRRFARCSISPRSCSVPDPDPVHIRPVQRGEGIDEGLGGLSGSRPRRPLPTILQPHRHPEPPPRGVPHRGAGLGIRPVDGRIDDPHPRPVPRCPAARPRPRPPRPRPGRRRYAAPVTLDADVGAAAGQGLELVERGTVDACTTRGVPARSAASQPRAPLFALCVCTTS